MIIKGTLIIIIFSLVFSYIRCLLQLNVSSTENINQGINHNYIKIILPLLISPILEEFIFRKWLPFVFEDVLGKKIAIFFSNLLFAILHFDIFFIPFLVNGLVYSYFYEITKDLRIPTTIHMIYNMFVFLSTFE